MLFWNVGAVFPKAESEDTEVKVKWFYIIEKKEFFFKKFQNFFLAARAGFMSM